MTCLCFHYCITTYLFIWKKNALQVQGIDSKSHHWPENLTYNVLDLICKMQCLANAFRSFVNRKSFNHISALALVFFLCAYTSTQNFHLLLMFHFCSPFWYTSILNHIFHMFRKICLFVCFVYSRLSNFSAIQRLSPLPVTWLQI
jgi:hypothetical protein